jgi:hypothetical protein
MLMLRALGWSNFEWSNFIGQQLFSIFLGIPPVTAMIVLRNRELARQHLREAVIINQLLLESPKRQLLLNQGATVVPPPLSSTEVQATEKKQKQEMEKMKEKSDKYIEYVKSDDLITKFSEILEQFLAKYFKRTAFKPLIYKFLMFIHTVFFLEDKVRVMHNEYEVFFFRKPLI